jgi:hypothetical protein
MNSSVNPLKHRGSCVNFTVCQQSAVLMFFLRLSEQTAIIFPKLHWPVCLCNGDMVCCCLCRRDVTVGKIRRRWKGKDSSLKWYDSPWCPLYHKPSTDSPDEYCICKAVGSAHVLCLTLIWWKLYAAFCWTTCLQGQPREFKVKMLQLSVRQQFTRVLTSAGA